MHATLTSPTASHSSGRLTPATLAACFWLFTYSVLLLRAELVSVYDVLVLSERRFIATTVGAILYWLILRQIDSDARRHQRRPLLMLALVLPASIAVMGTRLLFDQFLPERQLSLLSHLNWVLFWIGYFGTWVSISLAFRMGEAPAAAPRIAAGIVSSPTREVAAVRDAVAAPDDYAWLLDAVARDIAAANSGERAAIRARLLAEAGYVEADDAFDGEARVRSERSRLVDRVLARRSV